MLDLYLNMNIFVSAGQNTDILDIIVKALGIIVSLLIIINKIKEMISAQKKLYSWIDLCQEQTTLRT